MKVSLESFDLSLETPFLLPSSHSLFSKTCIFSLFLLTEPSQELKILPRITQVRTE